MRKQFTIAQLRKEVFSMASTMVRNADLVQLYGEETYNHATVTGQLDILEKQQMLVAAEILKLGDRDA